MVNFKTRGGDDEVKRACELLAKRYNVSKNTIIRDAEFAKGLNVLGGANPELKNEVLSGSKKIAKKDIQQLAKMPNGEFLGKVNTINDVLLKINSFKSSQDKIFQERALKKKLEREREIREYKLNIDEVFQSDEQRLNSLKARVLSSMKEAIEEDKIVAVRMGIKYLKEMELIIKNRKEKSKKK